MREVYDCLALDTSVANSVCGVATCDASLGYGAAPSMARRGRQLMANRHRRVRSMGSAPCARARSAELLTVDTVCYQQSSRVSQTCGAWHVQRSRYACCRARGYVPLRYRSTLPSTSSGMPLAIASHATRFVQCTSRLYG